MRAVVAVIATVIGAVTWATARSVRRYENDIAERHAYAVIDAAERIVRIEQSRMSHPSNGGKP